MIVTRMPAPHRFHGSALALALQLCACKSDQDSAQPIQPDPPPYLLDEQGRAVLYRGMNVTGSAKWADGYIDDVSDESLQLMVSAGLVFGRVLTFWDAVEPEEGSYDQEYLARLDDFLSRLDALGLAVMLDMHQDLWGVGFGSDGAPAWTCDPSYYDSYSPSGDAWYLGYLTPEVQACFDQFWDDAELQEQFAQAWAQLAALAREHPSVVGYDVLNEPFWGTLPQEEFEEQALPPFYERVIAAIRAADDERCDFGQWERPCRFIALEPSTHANLLPSKLLFPEDEHLVFAPHFYPTYAENGTGFDGDLQSEAEHLAEIIEHGQQEGLPVILGEYGIFSAFGNEHDYVRGMQEIFEARGASTAYWSWDPNDTYGPVTSEDEAGFMLPAFQRPYLHRLPVADLVIEPLQDGMAASFTAQEGEELVAVVPEICTAVTLEGAEQLAVDGVFLSLRVLEAGATWVAVSGCE